jgi:hypothetical protein
VRLPVLTLGLAWVGAGLLPAAPVAAQQVTVDVDAGSGRHAIDPRIYGLAFADAPTLTDLHVPLNRWGGNTTSRYNWQVNADNRGFDWFFESIAYASATPGAGPDDFIRTAHGVGAEAMMTIPTLGWVAKVGPNRSKLASFSIAKYGAQTGNDWQWFPDAGNGVSQATGQHITGNDPNDANVPADSTFQKAWVQHIVSTFGPAQSGGLRHYIIDNEPSIWHGTHFDVHPTGATMDEVRDKIVDYASKIKAVDPGAIVAAPEEWGWSGYFWSGFDQQYFSIHGWGTFPDRTNHGGAEYLPWLLDQMHQKDVATGQRLLDVFTVHYYPQGGEFGNDTSQAMQLRRNRSTRSLWDPNYLDESWINDHVQLVPRMKSWVAAHYPGTQVGITEYNWGAEGHMNGATAQADILGIFGREGLDVATRWTAPPSGSPVYRAYQMYRNYDGHGAAFGETSVTAAAPNPDDLAVFAAERGADHALTIMAVNKVLSGATSVRIGVANFDPSGPAQVWQLSAGTITRLADLAASGGALSATLPAQSITLFVLPSAPSLSVGDVTVTEPTSGSVSAVFTVALSGMADSTVTVDYATASGTATAGADFTAVSGTLTFAPGTTSQTVGVPVLADGVAEPTETFTLQLSNPTAGTALARAQATGTIRDAAALQHLEFVAPAYSVPEVGQAVAWVRRVGTPDGTVTVAYGTSDGTATAGADYTAVSGTLTFGPGITMQSFAVPILPDTIPEPAETFLLKLRTPTGAAALGAQATAVVTIIDNDPPSVVSYNAANFIVDHTQASATITVRRGGGNLMGTVAVGYATADGTATAGSDYTATSGTLTFGPNVFTQTFTIALQHGSAPVPSKTVKLSLSAPTAGAVLGTPSSATLTLRSLDSVMQFAQPTFRVGERGLRALVTVSRGGALATAVTVNYATSNGTGQAGVDYTAVSGTLSFGIGVAARSFFVPILDSKQVKENLTVMLTLSAPAGAALGAQSSAVLTILSDDPAFEFTLPAYSVPEAAARAVVAVRRSSGAAVATVSYATADGTATAGSDYTSVSGTLTFGTGITVQTFAVPLLPDAVHEGPETVRLSLQSPSAGSVLGAQRAAVLTIVDDDAAGVLQLARPLFSATVAQGTATITVTRTGSLAAGMTIAYATADGTAVAGTHYQAASGTLTFAAGETSKTFTIGLVDPGAGAPNRTVRLLLSAPGGGAVLEAQTSGVLWIVD